MSQSQLKKLTTQAIAQERSYEWLKAIESYEKALKWLLDSKDLQEVGVVQERIGYCFSWAAYQAENNDEFKKYIELAINAYEKASEFYQRSKKSMKDIKTQFCLAMAKFNYIWSQESLLSINEQLDECTALMREVVSSWEESGDGLHSAMACNELLEFLTRKIEFTWDWQDKKKIIEEAIRIGETAIKNFSDAGYEDELPRTYSTLSFFMLYALDVYQSVNKKKEINQKMGEYLQKSLEIAEKNTDLYYLGGAYGSKGWDTLLKGDFTSAKKWFMDHLEIGHKTKDNLLIASAYANLAYLLLWNTVVAEEEPDKRIKGFSDAIQYSEKSQSHYSIISYPCSSNAYMAHIDCYTYLALDETDLKKRRTLHEKAVEIGRNDLIQVKHYGSPLSTIYVLHCLCKALYYLSTFEPNVNEKRKLLQEAYNHRKELNNLWRRIQPYRYWNLGVTHNHLALVISELAKIETDENKKKVLLKEAVLEMEKGIELCKKGAGPQETYYLAKIYCDCASILTESYLSTDDKSQLVKAIQVYEDAVHLYEKNKLHSRVAEVSWKRAKLYNQSGDHIKSANEYEIAAGNYRQAADKIKSLNKFYSEYAVYMEAWSEIQRAKHNTQEGLYSSVKELYKKAANLHKSTQRWCYLHLNYLAWSRLAEAEDLSRREQIEQSRDIFKETADLFVRVKTILKNRQMSIKDNDERDMVIELIEACDLRKEYCLGRMDLEEAKEFDRQGQYAASSRKYGSAAQTFQNITDALKKESERRELLPILYLCKAWQRMTQAEAEASPTLYIEASSLFEEAKENSINAKTRLLAIGHSSFCKALEAGTRYEVTREKTLYKVLIQHLTSAATFYVRAGIKTALEYSKATQRLFEAYMYVENANSETDPEKKARWFIMAERVLEVSARSFSKALHPEKSQDVIKILENVRQERELALSLSEVLHTPIVSSTTTSFIVPSPSHEYSVGIEAFEHADLQANLFTKSIDLKSGEDFDLFIELFNTGREPASLVRIEEVIPDDLEVSKISGYYKYKDKCLDMKGRKIGPMSSVEIELQVKPLSKGEYTLKPRIVFLDDTGEYKSCEPEPVIITVTEIGILDWIRGSRVPR